MKVLVTGGAGFIGSYVVDELTEAGHAVTVFDLRPAARPGISSPVGDLRVFEDVRSALTGMDGVCHIGGIGDVYAAYDNPPLAAAVNVQGTANVLEAACAEGVGRIVYASTWEVYGRAEYQPIDEQHPCRPDHPYNITKYAGDLLCQSYRELRQLDTRVLRLGTAYGAGMRETAVLPAFIRRALNGETIKIHGTGRQFRQFTHVRDIARGFRLALESEAAGHVFNLVGPECTSVAELAELVSSEIPTEVVREESRVGDVPSSVVAAAAAEEQLGWRSEIPLRDGAVELIRSYQRHATDADH